MNWIKANKFLAGLIGITVVGAGVLGFLLFTAMGQRDEATEKFNTSSAELKRLQTLPIFPNVQNLKKLEDDRAQHQEQINGLLKQVAGMAPPTEQLSPEQFQDRLRDAVDNYVKDSAAVNLELPKPFYYGFDPYQGTPPRPEAVPFLSRQLKAMDFILRQLVAVKATKLLDVVREPMPEEGGKVAIPLPTAAKGPGPQVKSTPSPADNLLKKRVVQVTFVCKQAQLQNVLNALAAEKKWFIVTRSVSIKNDKNAGPPRDTTGAAAAAAAVAPAATEGPGKAFTFIVGEELIEVSLLLEVTIFDPSVITGGKNAKPAASK